jgi:hypothetical protein
MTPRGSGSRTGEVTYELLIQFTLIRMGHPRIPKNP